MFFFLRIGANKRTKYDLLNEWNAQSLNDAGVEGEREEKVHRKKTKKKHLGYDATVSLMNWHNFKLANSLVYILCVFGWGEVKVEKNEIFFVKQTKKRTTVAMHCCNECGENVGNQPSDSSSFMAVISVPDFDRMSLIQFCLLRALILSIR